MDVDVIDGRSHVGMSQRLVLGDPGKPSALKMGEFP
jgi:hypothetical protein